MSDYFTSYLRPPAVALDRALSLRPTLYIGLGGFGCTVLRRVKTVIAAGLPNEIGGFAFLGLDTYPQPLHDELTSNEYVPLSVGVDPNEVAKTQSKFLGWFRELAGNFKARNIVSGADATKAIGRLAFRQVATLQDFLGKLDHAYDQLNRFRDRFASGKPPKVYVVSTLAGGTGAGCLVDVLAITGRFFRHNLGADFPYHAVLATPDVLRGEVPHEHIPSLFANTYASLKELHYFPGDTLRVDYDDGRY